MVFVVEAIISALLSASLQVLFDRISPRTNLIEFFQRHRFDEILFKNLVTTLLQVNAVLSDAEEKQITNLSVRQWIDELKDAAYHTVDLLDEIHSLALAESQSSNSSALNRVVQKSKSKLEKMTEKLENIVKHKDVLGLKESFSGKPSLRLQLTSLVDETEVYGRGTDKKKIMDFLLSGSVGGKEIPVAAIIGIAGVGKTTLAQLLYNDSDVKRHFKARAWVYTSEDFDVFKVTKTIYESFTLQNCDIKDLNILQVELKKILSRKKFLIVFDDVWNEYYSKWDALRNFLKVGASESRIIVTTRSRGVASTMRAIHTCNLQPLEDEDCWSVFANHAFGSPHAYAPPKLKSIAHEIMKKCGGLPLAAKVMGSLLYSKTDVHEWKNIQRSNIWDLPNDKSDILPSLRLSYYYLSSHLKQCFAYCSIFPKGYVYDKEKLILLWMAEGFLQTNSTEKQAEDLGEEYFDDLQSRSFFQRLRNDASRSVMHDFSTADWFDMHDFSTADWFDMHDFRNDRFVMHDLINDLAQWAAKDFCTRIENLQEGEKQWKISENLCHLACLIDRSNYDNFKESGAFNKMKSVRTFLALSPLLWFHDDFNDFLCMVLQLRYLRVLSLKLYPIIELPNSIGDMKLLHHLDLSCTKIEFLPDSINKLYNLEELILRKCRQLKRLCSDMGNLFKLRHLNVSGVDQLEAMPLRIGKSTSLRTLQRFVVGKDMGSGLKELKDLKHLQERLHISGLENVNDFVDAENANLNGKDGLKDIQLEWTSINDVSNEKEIAAQVLDKLRPCQKLESLHIRGYRGTRFPRWLGHTSLSSLVSLTFEDCKNYASFPSIGQLSSLKKLVIRNIDGIESLGQEFYGHGYYSRAPFQTLEEFTIENLQDWKDWFPCGSGRNVEAFPHLQKLSIRKCSKLEGKLPEHLPSLKSLLIDDCEQWMVFVPRLPEDCTIQIANCKEVVLSSIKDCSSLSSMVHLLSGISSRMFLAEGFAQGFSKVEKLDIVAYDGPTSFLKSGNYSLLEFKTSMKLYFKIGPRLSSLGEEMLQQQELPGRCQYLILEDCQDPVKLEQALQSLSFLRGISITCSKEIKFFPETGLPSQLRFIEIDKCDALQSLPMAWMHSSNTNLKELSIRFCDSLTCIYRVQLPPNLKKLVIGYCSNLLSVLDEEEVSGGCNNTSCVEHLIIYSCPSLTSLWSKSNELPKALRYLSIRKCSKLESIAEGFHDNTKLEELYIVDCEKLETLPSGINNLTSLRSLAIVNCPGIVSFPEGGFPTSLTSLTITHKKMCKSLFEWGLHRLTSLEKLRIKGGCLDVMSFPQEEIGMILPIVDQDTRHGDDCLVEKFRRK